jgi:hypothetical protein
MEETRKTVVMRKGEIFADIFDSPESIAQARREGYSLVDPEEIANRSGDNLEELTRSELLELARQKGVFEKNLISQKKSEIIKRIQAAELGKQPEGPQDEGVESEGESPDPGASKGSEQEAGTKKHGFLGG